MKPIPATAIEAFRRDPAQYASAKVLLDGINGERDALEKGTYAENPQYDRWGTVWVGATAMRDGAIPPTWGDIAVGYFPLIANGNQVHGTVEVPEAFVSGGAWVPTIVFTFDGATTAGTTRTWTLEFTGANPKSLFGSSVTVTAKYTCGGGDRNRACLLRMPLASLKMDPGGLMWFKVSRVGSENPAPYLIGVSWAYQRKKFGREVQP